MIVGGVLRGIVYECKSGKFSATTYIYIYDFISTS